MRMHLAFGAAMLAAVVSCSSQHVSPSHTAHPATAAPKISAAAACLDFARWWLGTDTGQHPAKNLALLDKAVHEAPSGTLYQDMNAVLQVADGMVPGNPIVAVAVQAGGDCSSVNPGT